ncbi:MULTISPECIES: hypothetical protein [Arthrobacter]|uniref:hypothetical protein n=1 Tax=Arthrobacter TaxID=1663 RepID=UPI001404C994|nr:MULTISPECIES: hypothetical protein [Arthrobacter]MBT8162641.1 hypothetical protein [Arthrobacter sp. GN70]
MLQDRARSGALVTTRSPLAGADALVFDPKVSALLTVVIVLAFMIIAPPVAWAVGYVS